MLFQASYFKADFFKVLANPVRIQIIDSLRKGEMCVNDIAAWLEIESSSVSQQLSILRSHNFVIARKQGNQVFYTIRDSAIFEVLDATLVVFNNHLVETRNTLEGIDRA